MTLDELVQLIYAVDKKRAGCSVQLAAIADTSSSLRGQLYGIVTVGKDAGRNEYQRVFHDEVELRDILERGAK